MAAILFRRKYVRPHISNYILTKELDNDNRTRPYLNGCYELSYYT